ncbi:GntP family permease [Telmatospirillum sp. J64-1]|uniref:GntP family permease n=1 Tax=Telmatospirillum sp. J64-1 TaxID=2502183 RepID=UPI002101E87F|nr:GntP family permease [Telmatospirillum sp. J64-1]
MGLLGILLALALLMYFAYRGISVLILAPLAALLAVVLSGAMPLLASYTQIFMPAAGDFIITYFPLFLLGAIFGKLMDASGSAQAIANWAVDVLGRQRSILAVVLSCALLTYGGVSLFVVAFAVFPIAAALFRAAQIPKRLIPGTIALGSFTFTMTALPGTPAIQNAIPMPFFGTSPFAAPGLGVITGLVMFLLGTAWLSWRAKRALLAGEGYGNHDDAPPLPDKDLREHAQEEAFDLMELEPRGQERHDLPPVWLAILPVVLVVALNLLFVAVVIPAMDTGYLALPEYGGTTEGAVRGVWAITAALVLTILALLALNWTRLQSVKRTVDDGANASVLPIFNTASLVGFGAVIAALPAFEVIRGAVLGIGADNPLISLAVAVGVLAGITGSASGGMTIALQNLGPTYVDMAQAQGISLEVMHRVTTVATGGLDSLPHNGAVITLLGICGLTHREAYGDLFMVAVVAPVLSLVVLIALGTLFGSF